MPFHYRYTPCFLVKPKFHYTNFTETSPRQKSVTRLGLVSGKFRTNKHTDKLRTSFGESNELDKSSSLACLGEVCEKSATSSCNGFCQRTRQTRQADFRHPAAGCTDLSRGSFGLVRNFPETSPTCLGEVADVTALGKFGQVCSKSKTSLRRLQLVSVKFWGSRGRLGEVSVKYV